MNKFITISILLIVSRFYDVFTTYRYIPDLKGETNPLVSVFHFGWLGALTVQLLVLFLLIYAVYIYCFKTVETIEVEEKTTLREFISIFHFNNPNDFSKLLYKLPSNKHSLVFSIGGIVSKALIIISLIVGTSTTMLIFSEKYRAIYHDFSTSKLLILIAVVIVVLSAINFYKQEQKKRIING